MLRMPRWTYFALLAVPLALTGCGKSYTFGDVEGLVTLDGKPLADVGVAFLPDPTQVGSDSRSPSSTAVTDANGRFKLSYCLPSVNNATAPTRGDGAAVGWYKVIVDDAKMKREHGPPPGRVPAVYEDLLASNLRFEVKPGPQTINLELTSRKSK